MLPVFILFKPVGYKHLTINTTEVLLFFSSFCVFILVLQMLTPTIRKIATDV